MRCGFRVCVCVWTSENQLFLISGDVRVCTLATISCPILQKQTSFEHEWSCSWARDGFIVWLIFIVSCVGALRLLWCWAVVAWKVRKRLHHAPVWRSSCVACVRSGKARRRLLLFNLGAGSLFFLFLSCCLAVCLFDLMQLRQTENVLHSLKTHRKIASILTTMLLVVFVREAATTHYRRSTKYVIQSSPHGWWW